MNAEPGSQGADRRGGLRLLVGYDGSDAAAAAASFAIWLAGKGGADATLLHAEPELTQAPHASHMAPAEALAAAAEQRLAETMAWRHRLADLASYAADDASVECEVVRGAPPATLLEQARERRADLLLVGSTGVGAVRGRLLGSVSSQVVDHAPCPVLVFREGFPASPAHVQAIVIGVDGSPSSLDAVALARRLAPPLGASMVLMSAYAPGIALDLPTDDLVAALREQASEWLRAAREHAGAEVRVTEEIVGGDVRQQLLAACERHGPAVLAVGSRGLGGFAGLLLGSTSRWLLNHASCPVLVARGRDQR